MLTNDAITYPRRAEYAVAATMRITRRPAVTDPPAIPPFCDEDNRTRPDRTSPKGDAEGTDALDVVESIGLRGGDGTGVCEY